MIGISEKDKGGEAERSSKITFCLSREREREAEKGIRVRRRKETRSNWKEKGWCLLLVAAMSERDEGVPVEEILDFTGEVTVDFNGEDTQTPS